MVGRGVRGRRREVRAAIARGDVYQVNLVQHLSAPFEGEPPALEAALAPLRPLQPRSLAGDGWAIVSASPELFLARRGRRVWTKPIKGTRPLGGDGPSRSREGRRGARDDRRPRAERPLARVRAGQYRWPELMAERELAGVVHLVSTVEETLRAGRRPRGVARGHVPGRLRHGRAQDRGRRPHRGARAGRARRLDGRDRPRPAERRPRPRADIRTFAVAEDTIHLWVGGGIVWDSEPEAEIEESWVKARPLLDALAAAAA